MNLSNTFNFDLDNLDIIEEAFDLMGLEVRTPVDLEKGRNSLNLLLQEWNNHQVNLWTLEQETLPLTKGTAQYQLPAGTVDILTAVIRSAGIDTLCMRMSLEEYFNLPDKTSEGNSINFAIHRGRGSPTIYLWPAPSSDDIELVYWRMRSIYDSRAFTDTTDVPNRFLPALVTGLAYKLSMKYPSRMVSGPGGQPTPIDGVDPQRRQELKLEYLELFEKARDEDRDRASFVVVPYGRR